MARATKATPRPATQRNPVYAAAQGRRSPRPRPTSRRCRTRVAEYESRYARLKQSARMVPQIEAEFAQLNRDYDVNKKNYEALVARRESAEISGRDGGSGRRCRLPPDRPAAGVAAAGGSEPRRALPAGAARGACGRARVASFVVSQLWPTFLDSRALRDVDRAAGARHRVDVVGDAQKRRERRGLVGFAVGVPGASRFLRRGIADRSCLHSARAV